MLPNPGKLIFQQPWKSGSSSVMGLWARPKAKLWWQAQKPDRSTWPIACLDASLDMHVYVSIVCFVDCRNYYHNTGTDFNVSFHSYKVWQCWCCRNYTRAGICSNSQPTCSNCYACMLEPWCYRLAYLPSSKWFCLLFVSDGCQTIPWFLCCYSWWNITDLQLQGYEIEKYVLWIHHLVRWQDCCSRSLRSFIQVLYEKVFKPFAVLWYIQMHP